MGASSSTPVSSYLDDVYHKTDKTTAMDSNLSTFSVGDERQLAAICEALLRANIKPVATSWRSPTEQNKDYEHLQHRRCPYAFDAASTHPRNTVTMWLRTADAERASQIKAGQFSPTPYRSIGSRRIVLPSGSSAKDVQAMCEEMTVRGKRVIACTPAMTLGDRTIYTR